MKQKKAFRALNAHCVEKIFVDVIPVGWYPDQESALAAYKPGQIEVQEETTEPAVLKELSESIEVPPEEKAFDDMDKNELLQFADEHKILVDGRWGAKKLREAIQEAV